MSKRICKICGKEYSYCPTCGKDREKPRWYVNYDSENCRDIWTALVRHGSGEINKEKATELLLALDITGLQDFAEPVRKHINEILEQEGFCPAPETTNPETPAMNEPVVEPVAETVEAPVENETTEVVSEDVSNDTEKPEASYFKKKKK